MSLAPPPTVGRGPRAVIRFATRAIVGILGLWLAYLIVANGLLWSRAALLLAAADGPVAARYRFAWTVWPARFTADDLRVELRTGARDVDLGFERVRFGVALAALTQGRLVIDGLRGRGMSVRVTPTAPTEGIPPAHAPLGLRRDWDLAIARGCAVTNDLAYDGLRLVGAVKICGGLHLSAGAMTIDELRADIDGALIFVDGDLVGADLRGTARASSAPAPLAHALGGLVIDADLAMKTVALDAVLRRAGVPAVIATGPGRARLVATLERGRLAPGAIAVVELDEAVVSREPWLIHGDHVVAQALGHGHQITATLEMTGRARHRGRAVDLEHLVVEAILPLAPAPDEPVARVALSLRAPRLDGLGAMHGEPMAIAMATDPMILRGRGSLDARVVLGPRGQARAEVRAEGERVAARWRDTIFEGGGVAQLQLWGNLEAGRLHAATGQATVAGTVADAAGQAERWQLTAALLRGEGSGDQGLARATLEVQSLRPLASHPAFRAHGFGPLLSRLGAVRAAVVARWRPRGLRFTLLHARGDHASACGSWRFDDEAREGAALVEIGRDAWGIATTGEGASITRAPDARWRRRHLEPRRDARTEHR